MTIITITAFVKDGGTQTLQVRDEMFFPLADAITKKGVETVHLKSGSIQVVGFMVIGKQIGQRVIVLGEKGDAVDA